MAAWVQVGNRKLNLDEAKWIDRGEDGEVHVVFDGALTHTFRGPAADVVWRMISAADTDPLAAKPTVAPAKSTGKVASVRRTK
jgi:hypothetical protein